MRVNLLGSFEIYAGESSVNTAPAAQKMRQILAVLTLNANRVVRSHQLVDELWEDNPPASASTALQTYIYQIRKKFELGSPRRGGSRTNAETPSLSTIDGGYQLTLAADRVDAFLFEPLVSRGRREFQAGDHPRARDSAAAAMELWRDSALVDVRKGALLEAEALRLAELYSSARNLRIEADLHLGRHHELLGELTSLAALEPTNEGVQRSLMTALYRTDRRADALRVFHRARASIADELGLDPSPELQALHTAILNSDDSLLSSPHPARAVAAVSAPTVQAPCHVPAPQGRLTGRTGQLVRIVGALTPQPATGERSLVVVGGGPSSGKSELCLHAAQQVRDHYPDGQLFARLLDDDNRQVGHAEILRSFLRGLGATGEQLELDVTDLSLLYRTWTADRRVLVVLDDVTRAEDLSLLLPSGTGCGALVSGRRRLFVPSATEHITLDRLPLDDCLEVLLTAVPEHRITMDPEGVRGLAELCQGLPGALFAVTSKLRLRPHWTARQAITWITGSSYAREDPLGTQAGLDRTLAAVPAAVRAAFHTLAAQGDPARITPATAAVLLGTDEHHAEAVLEELVELYLLSASTPSQDGRFSYAYDYSGQALREHRISWGRRAVRPDRALAPPAAA